jgi:putative peptide zinc metalloprotease protein
LIFIPLPRTLTAPGLLEPALTQPLFIPVGGTVEWALPAGTLVRAGDVVFGLRDLPTELRLEELRLRRETLQRRLLAAEARRADEPELSLALPSLEEALQGVQEQLALAQAEVDRLQVTATSSGWLLPPPRRPRAPGDRQPSEPLPFWTGSPLDPENRGCHLARGELGCLITTGLQQVSLLVHQSEVGLLSLGQLVQFRERSWVGAPLRGTVTEIGQAPLTELPREIAALGEIPLNSSASGPLPKEPHYLVRVSLAPPPDSTLPGMVGWASVAVEPATVATRLRDWIHKNLRLN